MFLDIDDGDVVLMTATDVTTMTASGIPLATPQKHKDCPLFLKGPPVGSGGGAMTHLAPTSDSRRAAP